MEFFSTSRKNADSPISSFRKADDELMNNNTNAVDELVLLPELIDCRDPPFSYGLLGDDISLNPDDLLNCTWEERIEREIAAARRAAAALEAQLVIRQGSSHSSSSLQPSSSEQQQQHAEENDEMRPQPPPPPPPPPPQIDDDFTNRSVPTVNSYELLHQSFQAGGDPIAEERFLSFDSKEDIDYNENRNQFLAQQISRQIHHVPSISMGEPSCDNSILSNTESLLVQEEDVDDEEEEEEEKKPTDEMELEEKLSSQSIRMRGTNDSGSTTAANNLDPKSQSLRVASIRNTQTPASYEEKKQEEDIKDCLSATESEVASLDGLPSRIQARWSRDDRQQMLQNLDGIPPSSPRRKSMPSPGAAPHPRLAATVITEEEDEEANMGPYFEPCFQFSLCGELVEEKPQRRRDSKDYKTKASKSSWKTQHDVPLAILDCSNLIHREELVTAPRVPTSLVRVASPDPPQGLSFADTIPQSRFDPRMQDWIAGQFTIPSRPPKDGSFHLGKSRTVIVHEINRGSWTWCTAWSPDGEFLAVATENHHLAVVDTTGSTVWRVRHDRKARGDISRKNNSTHSIRSIAWGQNYIAIGFVGCLDWKSGSDVLAIGSRLDFAMIVRIIATADGSKAGKRIHHEILHRIEYKFWVNSIAFSPDGSCLAVGDSGGIVSIYDYEENDTETETNMITWFRRNEALLSVEWSPNGKYLYAGGEDRSVTVIDTTYWEIVHRIGRDRWVQCIAASNNGSHVAVGGVSSEISLLDVDNGWDSVMGIELKGLVPLSAQWHPKDQYLVVTGQDTSILAVETTNARHVKGHHLHSISPILSIEFSPDGRMVIVGNQAGITTFYSLSGTSFITAYELVIPFEKRINCQWSLNGMFVVIGSKDCVTVIGRKRNKRQGKNCPPNASGFSVKKVIRDLCEVSSVSIDCHSHYVAVSGITAVILDVRTDFERIIEWKNGPYYANSWSPDGRWLAMMGKEKFLTIYDTSSKRVDHWRPIFSMKCDFIGRALAWGPVMIGGLLYLAYGGDSNDVYVMEIRTHEGTWETVLRIPRDGSINVLDWSSEGLLAAGIGNGTVCIIDLAYLQSGVAVNEMDYNWQRQALTCFTEIRRNRGRNSIKSLRWLPAAPGSDRLLAVGGSDGEVEIIDLTERNRCRGYARAL